MIVMLMLMAIHFNPRPPRGGRLKTIYQTDGQPYISIHAPREGGDDSDRSKRQKDGRFQSTPPARGATPASPAGRCCWWYFNPRPPRGGRPAFLCLADHAADISIHAPREGGDYIFRPHGLRQHHFNPRPPRGGRHSHVGHSRCWSLISIHAPREGGDIAFLQQK